MYLLLFSKTTDLLWKKRRKHDLLNIMPVVCIPLIHFTLELCRYRVSNTRFHLPQQNNHHHTIIKKDRLLIIADMIFTGVNCQKHDKNCKFQKKLASYSKNWAYLFMWAWIYPLFLYTHTVKIPKNTTHTLNSAQSSVLSS